jgi:hypothetical protein
MWLFYGIPIYFEIGVSIKWRINVAALPVSAAAGGLGRQVYRLRLAWMLKSRVLQWREIARTKTLQMAQ